MSIRAFKANAFSWAAGLIVLHLGLFSLPAFAQEEVASAFRRYRDHEVSTGYYEEYEAAPRHNRPLISVPGVKEGLLPYSPKLTPQVRIRTRLYDAHLGIKFYEALRCAYCHPEQTLGIHTVRANLTCRQCHGGEPIAGTQYSYAPMNPIRRHSYVCAKCHEGANASFASYVVHEPLAGTAVARKEFPALHYTYWFMLILLVGTLAVAVPHALLIGLRELISKRWHKNGGRHHAH
ncbi:MAG: hypothetical protein RBT11_02145 [Desulfobacterales bacterium]|jgi:hypothetical protein|nr:hypothetical protein [Desulfobacterales bacterium]